MQTTDWDLVVIGAGAAGMMAAQRAAQRGCRTLVLERNRKLGVKILMSGGTRCNITHNATAREIIAAFPKSQRKFLGTALAALPPERLLSLLHQAGVPTKVEGNGKVFPVSDRAIDVRDALVRMMQTNGCTVATDAHVTSIDRTAHGFDVLAGETRLSSSNLLIACGGQSYPGCGTRGDGYAWARALGHQIVSPVPALVPLRTADTWLHALQGITVPDATMSLRYVSDGEADSSNAIATRAPAARVVDARRGSLLLTHQGLSGPVALDLSRVVTRSAQTQTWVAAIDFWPTVTVEECHCLLRELAASSPKKQIGSIPLGPLPRRLIDSLLIQAQIDPLTKLAEVSKKKAQDLSQLVKQCPLKINGSLGFEKAEVTAGGVNLEEVHVKTMQSRLVAGCYFVGEILDVDGPIGGYNFQAAFSTGWLAAESLR